MLNFDSDYMEGAHPNIIARMVETNMDQTIGYGVDAYCESAKARIREACGCSDAAVYLLVGGTQTNVAVLDQLTRPWEGVITSEAGHINTHEAGGPEAHGIKLLQLPNAAGKITAEQIRAYCENYYADDAREHITAPGVVYLSHPTEYGTIYSLAELEAIRAVCDEFDMRIFIDGARMSYGLAAPGADITLNDLCRLCDAFYIGGTKCGALMGEAVVFPHPETGTDSHFFTMMKKHGAVLAKGRMLGIQFDELFRDGLYFKVGKSAITLAQRIREGFIAAGHEVFMDSPTNQQFFAVDAQTHARLSEHIAFRTWERLADGRIVIRLTTSWATQPEQVDALLALL